MPALKSNDVEKILCRKGFLKENKDHKKFHFYHDGTRTSVFTMTSHNSQEIGSDLQTKMARQLHLSKTEFLLFISCQMTQEEYTKRLITSGIIQL